MKFDKQYMRSKDIDWFCIINGYYVHIASAGAVLPDIINDRNVLRKMQKAVYSLPDIYSDDELMNNERVIVELRGNMNNPSFRTDYLRSFNAMARKGFISLDRTNFDDPDDPYYHVVCMPCRPLKIIESKELNDVIHQFHSDKVVIDRLNSNILLEELFNKDNTSM